MKLCPREKFSYEHFQLKFSAHMASEHAKIVLLGGSLFTDQDLKGKSRTIFGSRGQINLKLSPVNPLN